MTSEEICVRQPDAVTRADLAKVFEPAPGRREQIGLELECGLVDPTTGLSVPYDGQRGGRALLQLLIDELEAAPLFDGPYLIGVQLPGGGQFSLEMGGALEYSSVPLDSLAAVVHATRAAVRDAAELARRLDIAVLSGSILPFTPMADVPWIPKPRVQMMRDFFRDLGEAGSLADGVMGLTLSSQVSLDYLSIPDLFEKLRLHVAASPVVAALFVNSPIAEGRRTEVLSRRMKFWRKIDPARCGVQEFALRPDATADDLVAWAIDLPLIYRDLRGGSHHHVRAPKTPFRNLLSGGFPDGQFPTMADWESLLSQVWPQVRVRRTLELRAPDGPNWSAMSAPAAIWTGLTYDPDARRSALDLLSDVKPTDVDPANDQVAEEGLAASLGSYQVREVGRELLRYARAGLAARVAAGLEPAEVLGYLDPLDEVAETGITPAVSLLSRWTGDLDGRPDRYVNAFRI